MPVLNYPLNTPGSYIRVQTNYYKKCLQRSEERRVGKEWSELQKHCEAFVRRDQSWVRRLLPLGRDVRANLRRPANELNTTCDGTFACHFFFQAEDGIRDTSVTGVQTCALPI